MEWRRAQLKGKEPKKAALKEQLEGTAYGEGEG